MTTERDGAPIAQLTERLVYSNRFVAVYDDEVRFPGGRIGSHVRIVEGGGHRGVAALPVSGDTIGLVRTYRYPLGMWEWGIPRGFADLGDPVADVQRELTEELGRSPETLTHLIDLASNSGLLSGLVSVFVAEYDEPALDPSDIEEIHAVRWIPIRQVREEIADGALSDGYTLSALGAAMMLGTLSEQ